MPELPEVETTRRGIGPHLVGRTVRLLTVRQPRLRWPVPADLAGHLSGQCVLSVDRRGKYLLIGFARGTAILHLGMSGSLRIVAAGTAPGPHDHVDLELEGGSVLRFTDPRRFGCLLWTDGPAHAHPLMARLGPEPLGENFSGEYLHACARGRRTAVKSLLMDGRIVVGVGNIYANEALFRARIHPHRAARRISLARYRTLARAVREVLAAAIEHGGTTLRDFVDSNGRPGYFSQALEVYGRAGLPCTACGSILRSRVLGQRATVYCAACQH